MKQTIRGLIDPTNKSKLKPEIGSKNEPEVPLTGFNYARYENEGKLFMKAAISGNKLNKLQKVLDKKFRHAFKRAEAEKYNTFYKPRNSLQ